MASIVSTDSPTILQRQAIHDLRNLFGIVASAKHILETDPARAQRIALLEAIEDAAARGGALTTGLLAEAASTSGCNTADISRRITELRPMALALAGSRIELNFDVDPVPAVIKMVPSDFDAAILELIANAGAADASTIVLRSRVIGRRAWVMVADNGRGMARTMIERAQHGVVVGRADGTGIARVRHFAAAAHGRFLIRSRPGVGTAAILILPTVLKLAAGADSADSRRTLSRQKETNHEDRQPATV